MRVSIGFHREAILDWDELTSYTLEAERLGAYSAWSAEAWAHDAATPLAYLAAKTTTIKLGTGIFQIGTRTPSLVGMTALALDRMSNGRFILGLGTSGPQVIEGWHGVRFNKPITRTRELIEIVRMVTRGQVVEYQGEFHQLPIPNTEGKALRSGAPTAENLPIYLAALGPKNLELCGELCDGWLGASFIPEAAGPIFESIAKGAAKSGRTLADFDLQAGGRVWFTDDVEKAVQSMKRGAAFSMGAMGSRAHNFYNRAYQRAGFQEEAQRIQELWLDGKRDEARAAVPDELVLKTHLVGDASMIRDRVRVYRDAGITTLRVDPAGETLADRIETLGRIIEIVNQVSEEPVGAKAGV